MSDYEKPPKNVFNPRPKGRIRPNPSDRRGRDMYTSSGRLGEYTKSKGTAPEYSDDVVDSLDLMQGTGEPQQKKGFFARIFRR